MTVDDAKRFGTLVDLVAEGFSMPASELKKLAYFDALADLEYEDVAHAMRGLLRTARYFPKPVEIRDAVLGDFASRVEAEWLAMREAMTVVGAYRTLICESSALGQTLVAVFGSWPDACRAEFTPEIWAAKRKEFDRVYRVFASDPPLATPTILRGLAQVNNGHNQDWSKFTHYGALAGRTARLLSAAEAQVLAGGTRLLEASSRTPDRELTPTEASAAFQHAFDRALHAKGMA